MGKCEYLSKLATKHKADLLALQETHVTADSAPSRYLVPGYSLVGRINHAQYGTITYAKNPAEVEVITSELHGENIHTTTVKIADKTFTNVYKPPNSRWPTPPLPHLQHPAIIAGDFNSRHTDWGYQNCNEAGEAIAGWANDGNLHLLYSPHDRGTFVSARWGREYNPDLVFVTTDRHQSPLPAQREVLPNFPKSQHRPVLITTGRTIPIINSLPKPRWNFQKADWEGYSQYIERMCNRIPALGSNMNSFNRLLLKSAKKFSTERFPEGVHTLLI